MRVSDFKDCPLVPQLQDKPGYCALIECNKKLPGRRRRWCSNKCNRYYLDGLYGNHEWSSARELAIRRDRFRCQHCGSDGTIPEEVFKSITGNKYEVWLESKKMEKLYQLEVNHIKPLVGSGYAPSHAHHLLNLVTLCHQCHLKVTAQQRKERKDAKSIESI